MIFSKKNNLIYEYVILIIGTFLMAFAIKNLYAPVNLVTGGVSGVSIILHSKFNPSNDLFSPLFYLYKFML